MDSVQDAVRDSVDCWVKLVEVVWEGSNVGLSGSYEDRTSLVFNPHGVLYTLVPVVFNIILQVLFQKMVAATSYKIATAQGLGQGKSAPKRRGLHDRFVGSFSELCYYSTSLILCWRTCKHETWFYPTGWDVKCDGFPLQNQLMADKYGEGTVHPAGYVPKEFKAIILFEGAWYLVNLIAVLTNKRKKDFVEMVVHHVITATLIYWSFFIGRYRISIMVITLHNMFDPFLQFAKCSHYLISTNSRWHVLPDLSFAMCAVVFAASRLVIYPYCTWVSFGSHNNNMHEHALNTLLVCLYPIHCFWFYLILQVLKKAVVKGTVQKDERSDSEGDTDDDTDNVNNTNNCHSNNNNNNNTNNINLNGNNNTTNNINDNSQYNNNDTKKLI